MWTFEITSGKYFDPTGAYISTGYAGHGVGVDNPADENIPDVGPVPENLYAMSNWHDDPEKGPIVCDLIPIGTGNEYDRSGFMIHGDSIEHPGQASLGCMVADRPTRLAMWQSQDQQIQAVAQFQPPGA